MTSISFIAVNTRMLGLNQRSSNETNWHLWRVIIPRRTITGRLVRGQVWRRHDGRHWLYKRFIDGQTSVYFVATGSSRDRDYPPAHKTDPRAFLSQQGAI